MKTLVIGLLVSAACSRGTPTPPTNVAQPRAAACSGDDDLSRPVIDTDENERRHLTEPFPPPTQKWQGPEVPAYVAKTRGSLELVLLDPVEGGYLALYRDPYMKCGPGEDANCTYEAQRFRDGRIAWTLPLNKLMSRNDHVGVEDIRLAGNVLYLNEACQFLASDVKGDCSSLVAVDPEAGRVLWRTDPFVSSQRFAIRGCHIVAAHSHTVHLIDRASGRVLQKVPTEAYTTAVKLVGQDRVDVRLQPSEVIRHYRIEDTGKLVALGEDPIPDSGIYGDLAPSSP